MLGLLKKRRWKEHVKLATQNSLACRYLFDLEQDAIEAGLQPPSPNKSLLETELETTEGYLSDLSRGEPLPRIIANDALDMNRELRIMYHAALQGRVAFASRFGSASERLLPFDQKFTPNAGWKIHLKHFAEREEEQSQTNRAESSENPNPETRSPVATSIYQNVAKEEGEPVTGQLASIVRKRRETRPVATDKEARKFVPNTSDALEYATTALMSDAYSHQAKAEVAEKFDMSYEDAEKVVRIAEDKILQDLESRNPETWKSLGLSSESPRANSANPHLDDFVDRGRMAGSDPEKLHNAFEDKSPEELKAITTTAAELAKQGYQQNIRHVLRQAEAFGLPGSHYVKDRGRIFVYAIAEDLWTQSFNSDVPRDATPMPTEDLYSLVFDGSAADRTDCLANFNRLQVNAVQRDQAVRLKTTLPDGAETSVRLHAAKWAAILIGLPLILRDEQPDPEIEWHFNDYPGSASIYRVRKDDADPLQLVKEVNWQDLGREVLESQYEKGDHEWDANVQKPIGQWTVYVDDNFHYMDESERYELGKFQDYEAAVAACQKLVDDFLEANDAKSADELFDSYVSFGEDPWIKGPHPDPERTPFSARSYARQRSFELRP